MTTKRRISRLPRRTVASLAAGFLLFTLACDRPGSSGAAGAAEPRGPRSSDGSTSGAGGRRAARRRRGEKALAAEGATVTTPSFRFELPATWRREQPSSGMRLAQAVVPGEAGPGELAVFHFGAGQGGGVEANFERWLGQVEQAAGSVPERGKFTVDGFECSWIDARGTLLPSTMGSGP